MLAPTMGPCRMHPHDRAPRRAPADARARPPRRRVEQGRGLDRAYVAEGVDVHVATCTGGERGSILNPKMDRPDILENISEVRRQEMERARDILGVRQDWLGFVDSGWPEGDPKPPLPEGCFALVPLEEAAAPLVRLIREFRPHVVTTYDERGGYPHPDHVKCHEVSVAAFEAAGDPERYPDLGRALAAAEALLPPLVQPAADAGAARRDARARAGVPVGGAARGVEARAGVGRPDHHPGAVRGLLRRPRPGAAGARHADRPRRPLVRDPARAPGEGLADRGLRARGEPRLEPRPPRTTSSPASRTPPERLSPCRPHALATELPSLVLPSRRQDARSPRTSRPAGPRSRSSCCCSLAVALLGWSLVRQLRKAQAAQDAGVYDDPDAPKQPRRGPRGHDQQSS